MSTFQEWMDETPENAPAMSREEWTEYQAELNTEHEVIMRRDINAAVAYLNTIKNRQYRRYAERLFAYYRDYGTTRATTYPMGDGLPASTITRIANTVRHYMVGDCDIKGTRI